MNRQQIAAIYDNLTEDQQNIPREQFIKRVMGVIDPVKNKRVLDAIVERKHQKRVGEMQKAVIDSAITRGKK